MVSVQQLSNAWDGFFFNPVPVYTIALFRIVFGIILLVESLYLLANLRGYLGPDGLVSYRRYHARAHKKAFSLFLYLPPTMSSVYLIMGIHIFFLILMIIGLFTPLSVLVVYCTLCSIVNRNPTICNGGDNVSRIMCFFLIFSGSGRTYSLDEQLFYERLFADKAYLQYAPWALRLMQIQVSIIYIFTVYWKLKGATYREGIAMYYVMGNHTYRRFPLPAMLLRKPSVQILTWGALLVEFLLGVGLWITDIRHAMVVVGFLLHLSIEYLLNVHLFSWYMMAALLLFINPLDVMHFMGHMLALLPAK